jgi:hypothetical protein
MARRCVSPVAACLAMVGLFVVVPGQLTAQDSTKAPSVSSQSIDPRLQRGAHVRFSVATSSVVLAGRYSAKLIRVSPDTIQVLYEEPELLDWLPWQAVSALEVSRGPNEALMVTSTLIGFVGGTVLVWKATKGLQESSCPQQLICDADIVQGVLRFVLAGAGGGVGGLIGKEIGGRDRWTPVALPRAANLGPNRSAFLGLTLAW